jgi:uncharacterized membrane protein YvbJ
VDEIKSTLSGVVGGVTKASGKILKSAKLSIMVAQEEAALKKIYLEIGKKVHEIYAYGGELGAFFGEEYAKILESERKLNQMRREIDLAKGVAACPSCRSPAPETAEFCPKCGVRIRGAGVRPTSQTAAPQPDMKKCLTCGAENDKNERFCLSCGRIL